MALSLAHLLLFPLPVAMEARGKRPAAAAAETGVALSPSGAYAPLIPGLPDEIAALCLARVPSLRLLWRVCPAWQRLISSSSSSFHSLRQSFGFRPHLWLYVLLHNDSPAASRRGGADAFSWHAFDPLSQRWHSLPPLPQPVDFQLTSPNFIGLLHAVQCASSSTKLFMVAGSRSRRRAPASRSPCEATAADQAPHPGGDDSPSSSSSATSSSSAGSVLSSESTSTGSSVQAAENSPPRSDNFDSSAAEREGGRGSELLWTDSGTAAAFIARKATDSEGEGAATLGSMNLEAAAEIGISVDTDEDGEEYWRRTPLEPALERPLIFDTRTRKWSWGPEFRVPRKWCACGTLGGKLVVASGCGRNWDMALSESAEMYDPDADAASQKWVALDQLRSSKFSGEAINAVAFGGKLHMVSGTGVLRRAGVMYDPAESAWVDMPKGMRNGWNGPTVVVDGRLLALDDSPGRLKSYDESSDCWTAVVEDERLIGMEQLCTGDGRWFCGIVRARAAAAPTDDPVVFQPRRRRRRAPESDVVRMVDLRDEQKPAFKDVKVPFGRIVALQVLSRTFSAAAAM